MNGTIAEIQAILILLGAIAFLVCLVVFIIRQCIDSRKESLEERERKQAKPYSKELFSPDEEEWFIQKIASNIDLVSEGYATIEAVNLIEQHYECIESLTKVF